jgi:ubiquinone/menaquinone biosynthesis C-methylase UbiE
MTNFKFDEQAVAEYHERRKRYINYGLDPYQNAEYIFSISKPIEGTILEVGTGRGLVTSFFARETQIVTLDIDSEIQSFAKELAKSEGVLNNITFLNRDILKEPYPDNSFGMVISTQAVHHFEEPEKIINAICRIALHKVVIADFNREGFDILEKLHREEGNDHSRGHFPIDNIESVMKTTGLKVNRHEKLQMIVYVGEK